MSDNTTEPDNQKSAEERANCEGDSPLTPETERNATTDEHTPSSPDVEVTAATVAELHRRLLDADNTVNDAETHITTLSELVGTEPTDSRSRSASVSAELDAAIAKLEETADHIDAAINGARELQESAKATSGPTGDEGEKESEGQPSMFDKDEYVRNTSDECSDQDHV
ncbi:MULTISPECIES: hypothetical protein [Halorubrum]|uniref:Uncharacterized protein n=1 Tax=Halorubrum ruber TaxID=2982524 RepID=A0A8T8LM68_9EURY|nr:MULTISPECIES: hypothetical protein [Halorubrum]QUO48157.1 hypothetical protein J7656_02005 [Halorubrum ruber]